MLKTLARGFAHASGGATAVKVRVELTVDRLECCPRGVRRVRVVVCRQRANSPQHSTAPASASAAAVVSFGRQALVEDVTLYRGRDGAFEPKLLTFKVQRVAGGDEGEHEDGPRCGGSDGHAPAFETLGGAELDVARYFRGGGQQQGQQQGQQHSKTLPILIGSRGGGAAITTYLRLHIAVAEVAVAATETATEEGEDVAEGRGQQRQRQQQQQQQQQQQWHQPKAASGSQQWPAWRARGASVPEQEDDEDDDEEEDEHEGRRQRSPPPAPAPKPAASAPVAAAVGARHSSTPAAAPVRPATTARFLANQDKDDKDPAGKEEDDDSLSEMGMSDEGDSKPPPQQQRMRPQQKQPLREAWAGGAATAAAAKVAAAAATATASRPTRPAGPTAALPNVGLSEDELRAALFGPPTAAGQRPAARPKPTPAVRPALWVADPAPAAAARLAPAAAIASPTTPARAPGEGGMLAAAGGRSARRLQMAVSAVAAAKSVIRTRFTAGEHRGGNGGRGKGSGSSSSSSNRSSSSEDGELAGEELKTAPRPVRPAQATTAAAAAAGAAAARGAAAAGGAAAATAARLGLREAIARSESVARRVKKEQEAKAADGSEDDEEEEDEGKAPGRRPVRAAAAAAAAAVPRTANSNARTIAPRRPAPADDLARQKIAADELQAVSERAAEVELSLRRAERESLALRRRDDEHEAELAASTARCAELEARVRDLQAQVRDLEGRVRTGTAELLAVAERLGTAKLEVATAAEGELVALRDAHRAREAAAVLSARCSRLEAHAAQVEERRRSPKGRR